MSTELQPLTDRQRYWLQEQGIPEDVWRALQSSLFPGANPASLMLYWHYCKARKLDPMKKPAHIVPMPVEDVRTGERRWQDVIMPGISEARITANRTGQYAGQDEPEFGPAIEHNIGNASLNVPTYCTVRVHKIMGSRIGTFAHTEYFEEAVSTKKDGSPNAMWRKRPRGMLAKTAEAGALRKAFPEELGGIITSDEAGDEPITVSGPSEQPAQESPEDALRSLGETGPDRTYPPDEQGPDEEPPTDATQTPSGEESEQTEPPQQEQAKSATATLYGAQGEDRGSYQRAGTFLNALMKLLREYAEDPDNAKAVWNANEDVVERIRQSGRQPDKLQQLESLAMSIIPLESGEPAQDDWTQQHDQQQANEIAEEIRAGLSTAAARGDVDDIRQRLERAKSIEDADVRAQILDELDEALTEAQETSS